jgi:antitoxin (DNA-binding transcriptional repressor) of toxin-antitoxin stability system
MSVMTDRKAASTTGYNRKKPPPRKRLPGAGDDAVTMRELSKLTAEQVSRLDHPVPITNNGLPVAWIVPLTAGERRRTEMILSGRLRPRKTNDFSDLPLRQPVDDGPSLSEILLDLRGQERT